ncbi:MAG: hypothetical protein AAGG75_03190 [Bacteroidota bacterium]
MGLNTLIMIDRLPDPEMDLADKIEVTEKMDQPTTYSIHYSVDICDGDISRLKETRLNPGSEMSIMVPEESGLMNCLVKGPVTSQQISIKEGGAGSWMQVGGSDQTIKMGREFRSKVWGFTTDSQVVATILATEYQLIPRVDFTSTIHTELTNELVQRSDDLRFIRQLASRNGFHFWIDCNPVGIETGNFRKPDLNASPKVTLNMNQEGCNVTELSINWDTERPTSVENQQLDTSSKNVMNNGSANPQVQSPLGSQSLRQIQGGATHSTHLVAPSNDGNTAGSEALLQESDWFVNANCNTTYRKIKKVLHVYDIVEVQGVGSRHSGKYMVASVKHIIDETAHRMEIDLVRNAWD